MTDPDSDSDSDPDSEPPEQTGEREAEAEPRAEDDGDGDGFYRDADDAAAFSLDLTTPRKGGSVTNGEDANPTTGNPTNGDVVGSGEAANGTARNGATTNGEAAGTHGDVTTGDATNGDADEPDESALLTDAADVDSDGDDDEVEPVELLVQLAEDGEIDPWDIDIVAVTDAFLERLDESDLRTSGRALFYASVLLRMKSDAILAPDDDAAEEEPWEAAMGGDEPYPEYDPIDALESEIDRRLDRKHARGSPETLDELVRELREAEYGSWWKEGRTYDTSDSPHGYNRGTQTLDYRDADDFRDEGEPDEAAVTGTAHMEDIEATIADVEGALRRHYDSGRDEVLFAEIRREGGRPVQTFLALLFLAHRGVVRLQQDDLFGDLWIQNPAVAAVGDEAVAD
jgi:segregation and condensation protein A